ncbi:hypothetical protein ACOSP7_001745 [Xanthoceras sorbifolium]
MTKEAGLQLGSKVGKVKDIDTGASGDCMGKFIRIRVSIDISKPLKRGIRVSLDDSEETIILLIRYERLPEYCFGCGMVGHHVRDCPSAPTVADFVQADNHPFGPWLRASSSGMSRPARGPRVPAGPVNSVGNTGQRTNSDGEQGDTAGARTNSAMQTGLEAATTMSLSQGGQQVHAMGTGEAAMRATAGGERDSNLHDPAVACRAAATGDVPAASAGVVPAGAAVTFSLSAQVDASKTGSSPLDSAAMEVDRRHFKWKRVARRGMVGGGSGSQLLGLGKRAERCGRRYRFHFEESWVGTAECDQIVENNWRDLVAPVRLGDVCDNIGRCSASLGRWNFLNRASLRRGINTKRLELVSLNRSVSAGSWRDIRLVEKELDDLLLQDEIY